MPLTTRCRVINGTAPTNITTEIYLDSDETTFPIQVVLFLGNDKKFGGETLLNLLEWEPNVFHHTISQLNNSPDPHSNIAFDFYYYKEAYNNQPLFAEQQKMQEEYR